MRAVVTGASGFLGAWTSRALRAAGHEVVAIGRFPDPWRLRGAAGVEVRSVPPRDWPAEIERSAPDVLLLLDWAGVDGPSRAEAAQFDNVDRQRPLIEAALRSGAHRIVGTGSQAEYGPRNDRTPESAALEPVTAYGAAKIAAGRQLRALSEEAGIEWAWARVFSVFGPLDKEGLLLAHIADHLLADEDVALSSGEQAWSYLAAPDAGRALATVAESGSGMVNVGHPDAPRLRDTIETFARDIPSRGRLLFGDEPAPGVSRLQPDTELLEGWGWRPTSRADAALHDTATWLRGDPVVDEFSGGLLPGRPIRSRDSGSES